MKYLVTGGAGFIGSALCRRLVNDGNEVVVLDNFSTGKRERIRPFEEKITLVEGDIRNRTDVDRAIKGVDIVFHEAALPSVARSVEDPVTSTGVNINGTLTVLESARSAGVKRLVYAASSSAYGDTPTLPKHEEMKPSPLSPYAISKLTGEYLLENYARIFDLETVALRYFNVFGPFQDPESQYAAVIPRFITQALKGEPATIYGDGKQSRDFTFVDNVVHANLLASQAPEVAGRVYNIACGERFDLLQLEAMIFRHLGAAPIPPVHEAARAGDVKHSLASIRKAEEELKYTPQVTTAEGLKQTVIWYKEQLGFTEAVR